MTDAELQVRRESVRMAKEWLARQEAAAMEEDESASEDTDDDDNDEDYEGE